MEKALIILFVFHSFLGLSQAPKKCSYDMVIVDAGCDVKLDKNKGYVLVDTIKVNVVKGDSVEMYRIIGRSKFTLITKAKNQIFWWILEKYQFQRVHVDSTGRLIRLIYMRN